MTDRTLHETLTAREYYSRPGHRIATTVAHDTDDRDGVSREFAVTAMS
ncbi:MAG: hypothetical protein O3C10_13665 [Chloroflexi bacterium]|nr:hypothetical protein [Chloroflexota bacterium]